MKEMVTTFEGVPLFTYLVEADDEVACVYGHKRLPIAFDDPDSHTFDEYADPAMATNKTLRLQAIVTQQLRKRIEAMGGTKIAHLIYKKRDGKSPLVAIIVADRELTFEVVRKVDAMGAPIRILKAKG